MKIDTDTLAKTLKIGHWKNVSLQFVRLPRLVLNFLTNLKMSQTQPTTEQRESFTKQFVVMTLSLAVAGVFLLFSYSVVFTQQPLFNESPVDKAIFAVLTLLVGQSLQILANYITKAPSPTQSFNPCQPTGVPQFGVGGIPQMGVGYQNFDNPTSGFSIDPTQAWFPPPPPTTPPTLEHEEERERMALARAEANA